MTPTLTLEQVLEQVTTEKGVCPLCDAPTLTASSKTQTWVCTSCRNHGTVSTLLELLEKSPKLFKIDAGKF